MPYFQIFSELTDVLFPWVMMLNGFSIGMLVADHFHTKAAARKGDDKKKNDGESK